ncbi:SDR family NAD(P)-dependent oxidoreductase [Jiangella alkaliphila]|uniref:NAD(P)-dependent dehydrogenase, short-chain alcohol dehydrogenase family n=1 Tax=Jiangella alkaliphila TaxID=419479 RepID=A0A1H2LAU6_9ACTN|nr:SDR family oxidoreductase [Jiangella alkaliphila]SDU77576.1 NAD(P)-dependent dehydrogenase, short-chain alcohol dehydrogenase family [Jiangella alkaliphila]
MRVLVCGGSGGIGSASAAALVAAGHQVHAVDRDSVDITQPGGAEKAVAQAVDTLQGLDGVVHAVGRSGRRLGDGPVSTCTDEAWREVHRVNLDSVFWLLRAALPVLRGNDGGGSVVVVGSALARTLDRDFLTAAYLTSKSAVETLVRAAAYEGAPDGVRVNVVAPGLVDTPMAARALTDPAINGRLPELMPLGGGRASDPDAVAAAVEWLLSPASSQVTGAVLPADGGWSLR